ncbi:carbohydrate-binding protein [Streptomyces sp. NRRL F-5755]|uniref:carbohydrate-binding protein n=1 Tax=Streptomyces sp. NRRL F-5755 TaxID=1519475 RepID=UPI0006AEFFC5|nr:carbohydrate-binding protein [Streptomyces sp. NRRL F-5755]KOU05717.1 carbohydrate-binding protein [Streptomyces sp. NRRL F-5755]
MTAGNNGAGTPEDDDPFAHLYRSEGGEGGAQGAAGGSAARRPGVPRASYNQVRAVGERQYGQRQYGQQQVPAQQPYGQQGQQPYGQQNAHYAAPETLPGGNGTRQGPPPGHGQDGPPRRSHKGLLIGAIAVVAVVCIGIGVAMLTNQGDKKNEAGGGDPTPTAGESVKPSDKPSDKPTKAPLPKEAAASLSLSPEATTDKSVPGAKAANGAYVSLNKVGAAATWSVDVPDGGDYTLLVDYGVPGKDAKTSLSVNGGSPDKINMSNFAHASEGAWDKGWTHTWRWIKLNKGTNTLKISCEQGDQCEVNLDRVQLKAGHVKG